MALLDLISPWAVAVDAVDSTSAQTAFRARHAPLLESVRRQQTPHDAALPLLLDPAKLHRLAARASDPEWQQRLRDTAARAAAAGASATATIALVASEGTGELGEPIPTPLPVVVLSVSQGDDAELHIALARGLAALTRWGAADSLSPVRQLVSGGWDRWEVAPLAPLCEWAYLEGMALHLASALFPALESHQLLGISRGALHRLRERERILRALFQADLDQHALGLVLRWLVAGAPPSARKIGDVGIPPAAGRYLAWRMTAERVARVGIAEALRMTADTDREPTR